MDAKREATQVNKGTKTHLTGIRLLHQEIKGLLEKPIAGIELFPNESDLFSLLISIAGPRTSHNVIIVSSFAAHL